MIDWTIRYLLRHDVELMPSVTKLVSGIILNSESAEKYPKYQILFLKIPPKIKVKTGIYVKWHWLMNMCTKFKSVSSKLTESWHITYQTTDTSHAISGVPWISSFDFLAEFWCFKKKRFLGSPFAFFTKIWPNTCIEELNLSFLAF